MGEFRDLKSLAKSVDSKSAERAEEELFKLSLTRQLLHDSVQHHHHLLEWILMKTTNSKINNIIKCSTELIT